ncbi:MAG: hypothetical protein ACHQ4J_11745 [Candidatus Binatia bacterium]
MGSSHESPVPSHEVTFGEFFQAATGKEPHDYQRRLAGDPSVSDAILDGPKSLAINVPTGAGKTAAGLRSGANGG